jgi:chromosome segregation ATPase
MADAPDPKLATVNETLKLHQELLSEARAAKAWRDDTFAPWRVSVDDWRKKADERLNDLEKADERQVLTARGDEENLMAELLNVKGELKTLVGELDGARALAGKLPAIESQIASAQTLLDRASKSANQDAVSRKRWRKYSPVITAIVAAIMTSLAQRFGLPPAAANDPSALLPGKTPTVHTTTTEAAQLR